jgi:SPP1 family predicted phage head-tail adaptor
MNPGSLRTQCRLLRSLSSRGSDGSRRMNWVSIATIWGEVKDLTLRERSAAQQSFGVAETGLSIRWRADIRMSDRIEIIETERQFSIASIAEIGHYHSYLKLLCNEIAPDGGTIVRDALLTFTGEPILTFAGEPITPLLTDTVTDFDGDVLETFAGVELETMP